MNAEPHRQTPLNVGHFSSLSKTFSQSNLYFKRIRVNAHKKNPISVKVIIFA